MLTEEKYRRLICYLWSLCRDIPTVLGVLILLRDLLCAQYMWLSSQRGHDTGKLGLGDFVDPENPSKSFAGFPLPAPALWHPCQTESAWPPPRHKGLPTLMCKVCLCPTVDT